MNQITYSFIIPHKNTPLLLKRCIESIPCRMDIQIIVVDDNTPYIDSTFFENKGYGDFLFLKSKENKGAGAVRNLGIKQAVGKWIIFADADDFFTNDFINILDSYKDSEYDVVYFNAKYIDNKTNHLLPKNKDLRLIDEYDESSNGLDKIKYLLHAPWAKMIKMSFLKAYNFLFEEISKGNDTWFSFQIGYFAQNVYVDKRDVYVYTFFRGSITNRKKDLSIYKVVLQNRYKVNRFLTFVGHREWGTSLFKTLVSILKRESLSMDFKIIYMYLTQYRQLKSEQDKYVNMIIEKESTLK